MKILYLCNKSYYTNKMSRVRFESMEAVSNAADVVWSGNGWENYDDTKTVDENIRFIYGHNKPDIIVAYKPQFFLDFASVKIPKCIRYNEMWPVEEWTKEITDYGFDLVIAHHLNDIPKYSHIKGVDFVHIPHSASADVYRDYGLPKAYDVLITGAMGHYHYPFRCRLLNLVNGKLSKLCDCKILGHPGSNLKNPSGVIGADYAKELNKAKITLTCSSRHKYRLGKYVEIPMCASILGADLPGQDQNDFKKFMLVLDEHDSDEVIVHKIFSCLKDDKCRNERIQKGLEWSKNYTHKQYAEKFLNVVKDFLGDKK